MIHPFQQIQSAMKSLVHAGPVGWKPEIGADPLASGTVINECYRIEGLLKQEGSRCLYAATLVSRSGIGHGIRSGEQGTYRLSLNEFGAKPSGKVFQMEVFPEPMDPGLIQRLLTISHSGIVQIFDVFRMERNSYVVLESIRGAILDRLDAMLTAEQIRMVGIYLTQTVEFLHAEGIYRMNLQPSNLEWVGDRARVISLSTCRLRSDQSREKIERFDREDFRGLLETLEKLAAEFGKQDRNGRLCRLLVTLEEMIEKDQLSATMILEELG